MSFFCIILIELSDPITEEIFLQLQDKIERLFALINLTLVKVTVPFVVLPGLFVTIINYFIVGLGDESFFLSAQVTYVLLDVFKFVNFSNQIRITIGNNKLFFLVYHLIGIIGFDTSSSLLWNTLDMLQCASQLPL